MAVPDAMTSLDRRRLSSDSAVSNEAHSNQSNARELDPPRIEHAFCVELGRVVTIDEARTYFVRGQDIEAFHFECSHPACAGLGVRIAGVNYRFGANERPKLVTNHFRRLDDHSSSCTYYCADSHEPRSDDPRGSSRASHALREDLIERFVPPSVLRAPRGETHDLEGLSATAAKKPIRKDRFATTSSLARLVDTYRGLVDSHIPNVLRAWRLHVRRLGELPISQYITPVYRADKLSAQHVVYGGARWSKAYGRGFRLRFIDTLNGQPVFLYVAPSVADEKTLASWRDEITDLQAGSYCTAYVLGRLERSRNESSYSISAQSADHIVFKRSANYAAAAGTAASPIPN
jgi:hypothetical protein